jgi:transcriptional regulator with XRE-family HTH domain
LNKKSNLKEVVARNLRTIREQVGLTQVELAARAKLTSRYISIAEAGQRNFRLDTLEKLASVLDVTVADLVSENSKDSATKKQALALVISILKKMHDRL